MAQRQRPISVNTNDRERLSHYKKVFEDFKGMHMTWGEFLVAAACLGMAAASIYQTEERSKVDSAL
jgi:hypothetical protein